MSKAVQPRFRRYSSETRAAMLVDASLVCLARGGILDFTIDSICREAGVSRGLITHHFGSKDGLLAAVYATMHDRLLSTIAPAAAQSPRRSAAVSVSSVGSCEGSPSTAVLRRRGSIRKRHVPSWPHTATLRR